MKRVALLLVSFALTSCGPTTEGLFDEVDAGPSSGGKKDASTTVSDSSFPSSGGTTGSGGTTTTSGGTGGTTPSGGAGGSGGTIASGGSGGTTAGGCPHPATNNPIVDDADLEPGPIVKFTAHLYYIKRPPNDQIINPPELPNGHFEAKVGDKIVYDSTQKNAANKICQWENLPEWTVSDSCAFTRLNTTNPFLLQMQAESPGVIEASATIDGITSNTIVVEAVP